MVKYIIAALLAFVLIALLALWILSGGPRKIVNASKEAFDGAVAVDNVDEFRLPWQPVNIFPSLDITDALNFTETDSRSPQQQLAELEAEYDRLSSEVQTSRTFGNPSPYRNQVTIVQDSLGVRSDKDDEYVQIAANYSNTTSIDITGWILESALSGTRVVIPPSASPFMTNSSNVVGATLLDPGALALVASVPSPVGVSFRENMCSGYLQQFQNFSPPLNDECPSPSTVLPLNQENLQRYGEQCFDATANLPSCTFPSSLPSDISGSCRAFLTEFLSYGGCVQQNRNRSSFQKNMWRVYLGSSQELWRNSHDAIRLLDSQGRTVSVFVY